MYRGFERHLLYVNCTTRYIEQGELNQRFTGDNEGTTGLELCIKGRYSSKQCGAILSKIPPEAWHEVYVKPCHLELAMVGTRVLSHVISASLCNGRKFSEIQAAIDDAAVCGNNPPEKIYRHVLCSVRYGRCRSLAWTLVWKNTTFFRHTFKNRKGRTFLVDFGLSKMLIRF